jgi:putative SOS response-associated peptidase YedK
VNMMTDIRQLPSAPTIAGEPGAVIRRAPDGIEMVNLRWGFSPAGDGDRSLNVLRSEGRDVSQRRCLIPASEFFFSHRGRRYRFTLSDGDWFYFAGLWRPASRDWPEAYVALTITANDDVAPFHDRQMAVIRREDRMRWLDLSGDAASVLRPLPAGSFVAADLDAERLQPAFAF